MRRKISYALLLCCFLVNGCNAQTSPTAQTTIASVAVALTLADQLALACITEAVPACVSNKIAIKATAQTAYAAVKTAEATNSTSDLQAAQNAVAALKRMVPAK